MVQHAIDRADPAVPAGGAEGRVRGYQERLQLQSSWFRALAWVALVAAVAACAGPPVARAPASDQTAGFSGSGRERKIVRANELVVSVGSPTEAASTARLLVDEAGGFVERSAENKDENVSLHCRVPPSDVDRVMDAVAALGDEESRSISATDVTDRYNDLETRLRNNLALRERLQQLLERAESVEDVLAIEKELNRLQSEIETMQARLDRLDTDIALSTLTIDLRRKRVLGPLGYLGYGIWWVTSKLFVIH